MLPILTRSKANKQTSPFPPCLFFVLSEIWATLTLRPISKGWWLPFLMGTSNRAALSTFLVLSTRHKAQDWKCTGLVLSTVSQALTRGWEGRHHWLQWMAVPTSHISYVYYRGHLHSTECTAHGDKQLISHPLKKCILFRGQESDIYTLSWISSILIAQHKFAIQIHKLAITWVIYKMHS